MITIILNHKPYDGSDVAWNALQLAKALHKSGQEVNIFLMNDEDDLARDTTSKPESYHHDFVEILKEILKEMYASGINLQVCGNCNARFGLFQNEPYFDENISSTMQILADWVIKSDKVMTF